MDPDEAPPPAPAGTGGAGARARSARAPPARVLISLWGAMRSAPVALAVHGPSPLRRGRAPRSRDPPVSGRRPPPPRPRNGARSLTRLRYGAMGAQGRRWAAAAGAARTLRGRRGGGARRRCGSRC
jgi:hypothetical protein